MSPLSDDGAGVLSIQVKRVVAPIREQVLDQLRDAIVRQRLAPGQRLIERELTEQTGVSRTTIREVLRELAAEGLVVSVPNKGTVVASVSLGRAAELYEVRAVLESMAVRQFAAKATPADLAALRRALNGIEAELGGASPGSGMLAAKKAFYDALFAGARNQTIAEIVEGLQTRVSFLRATSMAQPGRPEETLAEVREIVEALEAGDADRAAEASAYHVRQAAQTVFDALGDAAHDETGGS
jgi:GntR family transcriptional regulator, trigonelline degradation regulator